MSSLFNTKTRKILIIAGLGLGALVIYRMVRGKKTKKIKQIKVADEGYETAEDILFPKKRFIRFGS
jgi:hypothetical protein